MVLVIAPGFEKISKLLVLCLTIIYIILKNRYFTKNSAGWGQTSLKNNHQK